jgi:hypothetical protein
MMRFWGIFTEKVLFGRRFLFFEVKKKKDRKCWCLDDEFIGFYIESGEEEEEEKC